ncbi:MAG: IMP dehydrogenase, partial [Candidatus Nanoarchaeia archaeon]
MRDPLPKELFFEKMEMQGLALTYNDVRLKTGHSEVMPDDVAIESRFARNIPLRVPIVSSAMDTV